MKIISEPLKIGAADLLKGVDYSHCGVLFVHAEKRKIGNPWDQRYVILSEGCLYIYKNKNSKTTKDAYSLQHFEYVRISEPESEEKICFCLHYNNRKPPKLFSCDTPETREEWIQKLGVEMTYVQKTHSLSADSGYGSAGAIQAFRESGTYELDKEGKKYDTVNERRLFSKQDQKVVQTPRYVMHDAEESDYEPVGFPAVPNACKGINEIEPDNQGALGHGKKIPIETKPTTLMAELSQKLKSDHKGLASGEGAISHTPLRRDSKISVASSFLSIHGGHETSDDLKSVSSMSEQLHESDK